jgi:hypothetical protein
VAKGFETLQFIASNMWSSIIVVVRPLRCGFDVVLVATNFGGYLLGGQALRVLGCCT